MPAIILFAVWKNFGYNMIIFLAGLQSIPRGALRGGAHRRRLGVASSSATSRCRRSRPSSLLVSILTIAGYFQLFAEPYVMTQGGPLQSTVSVLYFMYEEGFKWWNLGSRLGRGVHPVPVHLRRDRAAASRGTAEGIAR